MSYLLCMTIYLVFVPMHTNCKRKLGSEHATTQHTVNVVMHVPQRSVNKIRYNRVLCKKLFHVQCTINMCERSVNRKQSLN